MHCVGLEYGGDASVLPSRVEVEDGTGSEDSTG